MWVLKLDVFGEIPGCSAIGVSNATIQDTSANINVTNVTGVASSALAQLTAVVPSDTTATETMVCGLTWAKTYWGGGNDGPSSIQQTSDGGYVVAGYTSATSSGSDAWVVKLDGDGNVVWQNAYGGAGGDGASSIQQLSDGGFIVVGGYSSTTITHGIWVLKLHSDGGVAWQNLYRKGDWDDGYSIQQTSDGDFILAGTTRSVSAGGMTYTADACVLKLDGSGNIIWSKTYGGSGIDVANSIHQTSDKGYIVAGYTDSFGAGMEDVWVLKLGKEGNVEWQRTYGGSGTDAANSIHQTSDFGYIVAGYTNRFGASDSDAWVLKLDADGKDVWQKTYGGSANEQARSIQQTSDGGYVVAGWTASFGPGDSDAWVLKLRSDGGVAWQKSYDGMKTRNESADSVQKTLDSGYIVAGYVSAVGYPSGDLWVLKLDSNGDMPWCSLYVRESFATATVTHADALLISAGGADTGFLLQSPTAAPRETKVAALVLCPLLPWRPDPRPLTLTKSGDGSGVVTSVPAGINCGSLCSATFALDMPVVLSAIPAPGSIFTGWSGICTGTGRCAFRMLKGGVAVTANFDDGIESSIDIQPSVFSNDFSYGSTYGTIVDRGNQLLLITPYAGGVNIKADAAGGLSPARVFVPGSCMCEGSACGSATFTLSAGDEILVTCGSVGVKVLQGTVEITFIATIGTPARTSLTEGNSLIFEPTAFTLTAPASNKIDVIVFIGGEQFYIHPGQTVVLAVMVMSIDIKPGSYPNSINPKSKGNIPVAILSTASFNAPARVDGNSLTFGRTGDEKSLAFCNPSAEDVNKDGLGDLICHFNTQSTGFQVGDTKGVLKGRTIGGLSIEGSDSVKIVP